MATLSGLRKVRIDDMADRSPSTLMGSPYLQANVGVKREPYFCDLKTRRRVRGSEQVCADVTEGDACVRVDGERHTPAQAIVLER